MPSGLISRCLSFSFWSGVLIYFFILFVGVDFGLCIVVVFGHRFHVPPLEGRAAAMSSEPAVTPGRGACLLEALLTGPICVCLLAAGALHRYVQVHGGPVLADGLS